MRKLLMLLLLTLLLTGCAGRQMEEELLVIALGVDQEAAGVRVAVKAPAAAQQQDEQKGYLTLEAAGRTLSDALLLLHASTPRKLNFSQVREILINRDAAESPGLPPLIRALSDLPHIRGAAALIVCTDSACEVVRQLKPYMGLRLSRYTEDNLADSTGKGFTPNATLAGALRDLGSGLIDPMLIRGAINDFTHADAQSPSALAAPAGSLPRRSDDPIDLMGAAVTDGSRVTGYLTGEEMALIHLLTGAGHFFVLRTDGATATLHARTPARLAVDLSLRPIRLTVDLLCEVELPPGEQADLDTLRRQAEDTLRALLQKLQGLHSDALGFGLQAVRQYLFIRDWEQADFPRLYRQAQITVSLPLRLRAN